uniref:Cep57_CLD domain-containing protein n=1 Tax=Macrostomum lignano TaxID=282301 RepID=A0A1I8JQZ0_9PLAT
VSVTRWSQRGRGDWRRWARGGQPAGFWGLQAVTIAHGQRSSSSVEQSGVERAAAAGAAGEHSEQLAETSDQLTLMQAANTQLELEGEQLRERAQSRSLGSISGAGRAEADAAAIDERRLHRQRTQRRRQWPRQARRRSVDCPRRIAASWTRSGKAHERQATLLHFPYLTPAAPANSNFQLESLRKEHEAGDRKEGGSVQTGAGNPGEQDSRHLLELERHHEARISDMSRRFEEMKASLSEKLVVMQSECNELRSRERWREDAIEREAGHKTAGEKNIPCTSCAFLQSCCTSCSSLALLQSLHFLRSLHILLHFLRSLHSLQSLHFLHSLHFPATSCCCNQGPVVDIDTAPLAGRIGRTAWRMREDSGSRDAVRMATVALLPAAPCPSSSTLACFNPLSKIATLPMLYTGLFGVRVAISAYKDLPDEIDSLKTVLELKQREIAELRSEKAELQEKLGSSLADEKHQQLMRKFDRQESRAKTRLSMNYDEPQVLQDGRRCNCSGSRHLNSALSRGPHAAPTAGQSSRQRVMNRAVAATRGRGLQHDSSKRKPIALHRGRGAARGRQSSEQLAF